jgi:CubicO group peptidase (beta-lactamase class C family)
MNTLLKSLIAAALLSGVSSFIFINTAAANTKEHVKGSESLAPEVSSVDAKLSFWDMSYLEKAFIDTTPADRKDGLAVGDLVANGGNKALILQLAQEITDQKHGKYDSLLIAHQDKLIFESYYLRGRVNLPHFQNSGTKGYTSLALGRAIQLGYLTMADLDKPLFSFLKGLDPTKFVDGVEKITLHHAMTMRSGLRFSDEHITKFRENPEQFKGLDQVQAFFEYSDPVTPESQIYKYQGPDPIMVMHVLDAVVTGSAKDFIKNELFDKLGINNYSWRNDLSDLPIGDSGASMTSRDMVKLGSIVINKGQWLGKQLISAEYLAKATSGITKTTEDWQPDSFNYGYFWYQTDVKIGDKSYDIKVAWGAGGNRIIVIDDLDLIIVITGHDLEDTIFSQVSKIILPAFVK